MKIDMIEAPVPGVVEQRSRWLGLTKTRKMKMPTGTAR
jgi:hypothetical protein